MLVVGIARNAGRPSVGEYCRSVLGLRYGHPARVEPMPGVPISDVLAALAEHQAAVLEASRPETLLGAGLDVAIATGGAGDDSQVLAELTYRRGRPTPFAVVNLDDPAGADRVARLRVPYLTYGLENSAHLRAEQVEGTRFVLACPLGRFPVQLGAAGPEPIRAALAAFGLGIAMRLQPEQLLPALESVRPLASETVARPLRAIM